MGRARSVRSQAHCDAFAGAGGESPSNGSEETTRTGKLSFARGDYRVLYTIDDKTKKVFIMAIGHRREVYR
ncbi:MAG: type II toxin-antitoxin system RelE/ParE family toxin [Anaerolineales bacterium]|nr:type II toxin-antitoxin system RelE/ParE family toxin [Anaerolineales bacterium]